MIVFWLKGDTVSKTAARHDRIREHLASRAYVNIHDLALTTGVSEVTIRRDLRTLEQLGIVARAHGGARLADDSTQAQELFAARELRNPDAKSAIGLRAAELIDVGEHVAMNDGTTVMQVAASLDQKHIPATVTTNALNVALRLSESELIDVYVLGGLVRRASFGTYDADTSSLDRLNFDTVILGIESMSETGITVDHPFDLAIAQSMIRRAARVIVVADASKWRRRGRMALAAWDEVDLLVTDTPPSGAEAACLAGFGVEILSTEKEGDR